MSKDKNKAAVAKRALASIATTGRGGRFSAHRKTQAVLRLMRGEDLELLSRELGVVASTLSFWRNWETDPRGGGLYDPYWTPMNKPVGDIMTSHYQNPPDLDYPPAEDFESGDFNTFDWLTYGDEDWVIASETFMRYLSQ